MKNINISNIILAAEKMEKEKVDLEWQVDQAIKKAGRCATDKGRADWQEIASDLKNEIKNLDTSFYNPLDEALATFEKSFRIRNFESAKNLLAAFQKVLDKINIPKKYFDGTTISIKAYGGVFPAAYKGVPTTTEATFFNKNGKWYLVGFARVTARNNVVNCIFSTVTKEAIVKRFTTF